MIKGVMFDMGGTLEDLFFNESNIKRTAHELYAILQKHGIEVPYGEDELWALVYPEILRYKEEAEGTLMELKPEQIWADYGFCKVPVDRKKLIEVSEEIAHMWEVTYFDRSLRKNAAEMLAGLKELGLYVCAVSNTASLFQVFDTLEQYGVRVETDLRNEKIGFKIREAQMNKIPYMLVIGDKEIEQGLVAVRSRKDGDLGTMTLADFRAKLLDEIATKAKG